MTDAAVPVLLTAGDKQFQLASDINAFCDLEDAFGQGINQIIARFQDLDSLRLSDVRGYLRVLLRSDGKPLQRPHADDICAIAGIAECNRAISAHLTSNFATKG